MATLVQHMRPYILRYVGDSEARMEQMMDRKIQAIHKLLDAFQYRVMERPAPIIDAATFQTKLASLCADVDALLAPTDIVPESTPAVSNDEVVMTPLFCYTMPPPHSSFAAGKRPHSAHTFHTEQAQRLRKKERQQLEAD
ncbi:hypothetical protein MTR67_043713 [Solanum verrucosum]|uniref:Integrase core domain containing protein n=1 Tax=Solanum verrucosum TaxID=315347 RepID=A0AAF0ZUL0_SOLVR|nr:hypothetical protein MTR67_043713 [Solanum verrucosum]